MKKRIALLVLVTFAALYHVHAQTTPLVNERQANQRDRIRNGVATGELTRVEAANARQDQRSIRRTERRVKADGVVTSRERARLHHKQNEASRHLRRNKHDRQRRC